jgi:crotonobetainyl-CoA:carnitine CoA-transferase CaiB-like acyl-CoA transferase
MKKMENIEIFKGLKVVEFASVLAGPAVGMFFAELGADVLKIENATTKGDVTRTWKLASEAPDSTISAYFAAVNYGKQHLFLNLNEAPDRQSALDILENSDIVISNFRPSWAQKMGLDYTALALKNPKLIYAQLNGYDDNDETPAFDVVLQAETGFMYMNGEPRGNPIKMPVALIDILAAHQLKQGILIALLKRKDSGLGCEVSTSLYDSALASLANQATNWLMEAHIPEKMGSKHPNIAPYGDTFKTADNRDLVLACGTQKHFTDLCSFLNLKALCTNPHFVTNQKRLENRAKLVEILQKQIIQKDAEVLVEGLKTHKVPAGIIKNMKEVLENPNAQSKILTDFDADSKKTMRRMKTVALKFK